MPKKPTPKSLVKGRKCPKCKIGKFEPVHSCPYQADIAGDHSKHCNCCTSCQDICADDI